MKTFLPFLRQRNATLLLALCLSSLPTWAAVGGPAQEMGQRRARLTSHADEASLARVIVKYRADHGKAQVLSTSRAGGAAADSQALRAATLSQRLGLPLRDGRVLGERTQALRGQGITSAQLVARLREQADVEWAVLDERRTISALPNDPYYGGNQTNITPTVGQWYLRAPEGSVVSSINIPGAWAITPGSANITVAVLDTGVRFDHPDLKDKLYPGYDFITDLTDAADGGGRDSDASDPGDWVTKDECAGGNPASDSSWHGTQTAGIVGAATDNGVGMAGVGRNVMVLPLRVLGKCGGSDSDIIAAMRWAAGLSSSPTVNPHPAQVISMSLGKSGTCPQSYVQVMNELTAAGVTVVVAAGNGAGTAVEAPANCAGVLAVGGVRHVGTKVGFSSLGPEVAISAPGGNCVNLTGACLYAILTTTNAGTTTPSSSAYSDSFNYSVGTSFSTPMVAGVVGLMLSANPRLTPAAIKSALQSTARPFPVRDAASTVPMCVAPTAAEQVECHCTTSTCGAGMLDAAAAVAAVAPAGGVPPSAVITASNAAPTVGETVTLSAAKSSANGSLLLVAYQWQITNGASLASLSGAINTANASLITSGAGAVTVSLTVTDNAGASSTSTQVLNVQAAAPPVTPPATGGGGGGGASSTPWVLLILLAAGLLLWCDRQDKRRSSR